MKVEKSSCMILAEVLAAQGIRDVVVSPGSRCAPLTLAFDDHPEFNLHVVTDERSAAFIALGIARTSRRAVALICTSGSALLNYAPAVAEACYQNVPLIILSADRPEQWIDQDDSQTIRQRGALANFVRASYDIPDCLMPDDEHLWYANRIANDACLKATGHRPGPVHINVQLHAPLTRPGSGINPQRIVHRIENEDIISRQEIARLAAMISDRKIMIVAGFIDSDHKLNRAVAEISKLPNVVLFHETLANLHISEGISCIDTVVGTMSEADKERLRPDIVITFGGALVSRFIKQYLRAFPPHIGHWAISNSDSVVDCFKCLTYTLDTNPAGFFRRLAGAIKSMRKASGEDNGNPLPSAHFAHEWYAFAENAIKSHRAYLNNIPWSDMKAMKLIFDKIPSNINLHLSNGTPVRYAQLLQSRTPHAEFCNRGVSGIDGCTSTALGSSIAAKNLTLLITGDLSFSYDLSALAYRTVPSSLRIIVCNNSGGAIFRFVGTTANLPPEKREKYFCADPQINIAKIADAFGFSYLRADNEAECASSLNKILAPAQRPIILEIVTDSEISAKVLSDYFKRPSAEN